MSATAALHHANALERTGAGALHGNDVNGLHPGDHVSHGSRMWSRPSCRRADYLIARVEGELDATLLRDFRDQLERCRRSQGPVAVLDLRATTFMCIRSAAMLAEAKAACWRSGTELRLVSGRKETERVLELVGARPLFCYYASMREAIDL